MWNKSPRITWQRSLINQVLGMLPTQDRRKLKILAILQSLLSLLDFVGVSLFGILGALAITGVRSIPASGTMLNVLNFLGLGTYTLQVQVSILGLVAAAFLISKTLLSIYLNRKTLYFLNSQSAQMTSKMFSEILELDVIDLKRFTTQELLYLITYGVHALMVGILATSILMLSDFVLLLTLTFLLFALEPLTASVTFMFFTFIALSLYLLVNRRAHRIGNQTTQFTMQSEAQIQEALGSFREIHVRDLRKYYDGKVCQIRTAGALAYSEMQIIPTIGKYVIESSIILGALIMAGVQFLLSDANRSISALAIFLASASRLAPAILRLQQGAIGIKSSAGISKPTLDLISFLQTRHGRTNISDAHPKAIDAFVPTVNLINVSFRFPDADKNALSRITFEVHPGEFIAIVGPSGGGKSTLVDAILGLIPISEGSVEISGLQPRKAIKIWPNSIGYVPQSVFLSNRSIRENIALGKEVKEIDDEQIFSVLKQSKLADYVKDLPDGLDTLIGELGSKMSGGQRQRLGIARALFTKPQLLILDEATSSLDGETEEEITDSIQEILGHVTVIAIAHRLSTIRKADRVVYLSNGEILAIGSLDQVRKLIPDFDRQARLMGLEPAVEK